MAGDAKGVEARVKEMVKADLPNMEEVLGFLVSGFCGEGRLSDALRVFRAACSEGRLPSISVCNGLMDSLLAEWGDLNSLVFVYKEMVKGGVVPSVDTVNCLIEALFRTGHVDAAIDQFRRMNRRGCVPNSKTFQTVMLNLCVNDRAEESSKVLDEMIECRCKPDPDFFGSIMPLLRKFNTSIEAKKLLKMMRDFGVLPDLFIYCDLIHCLCENGELDDAAYLLEEMSEMGIAPDIDVYVSVVNGFCKVGRFNEATIFLESNDIFEPQPYNALLKAYCSEGRFPHAGNFLTKMFENGVGDNISWNILTRALCDSENPRKASEVLSRMITSGYLPDEVAFSSLIAGYSKAGEIRNALLCFQHVLAESWVLDSESYSSFIHALCHEEMIQEAMDVFYYMSGKGHSLPAASLNLLISHICWKGLITEAIKLRSISFCNGSPSSSTTFNSIILRLLELKRPQHARVLFSQMLVEDCALDVKTYCLLIRGLCTTGGTKNAMLLFAQMINIALLNCLEECSQMHKIVHSLDNLVEQGQVLYSPAYNIVIRALLKEAHKDEACKFLDQMLEQGCVPDADTHGLLVRNIGGERKDKSRQTGTTDDSVTNILVEGLTDANEHIVDE
ncbi:unnamed protein product [Spirodela intermedia]|uniref:Uncharacterized protein n=1 Tax=Spirodela intermedia TaxID=51605 RepID=A0A7I8JG45_SPIIN|nr:unnamed protein product [Spirodela intermedia]CAA6668921.1 unnamed protein product [Spirodela intermedia]